MKRDRWLILTLLSAVLTLAACTGETDPASTRAPFEGATFVVTSTGTTENVLLGKITATVLAAHGARITDQTESAGDARSALTSGQADMYWEYTGTAWVSYKGNPQAIADPVQQYQEIRTADASIGIAWLDAAPLNRTYAIAVAAERARQLRVDSLSDLARLSRSDPAAATFCMESEFSTRSDGFPGMLKAYDITVSRDNVTRLDPELIFDEVAQGKTCTFGAVFATDGRLAAFDLSTLEDDRNFFPHATAALTVRQEILDAYPKIADVISPVTAELDDTTMTELNTRVDADGESPQKVAETWLQERGMIQAEPIP